MKLSKKENTGGVAYARKESYEWEGKQYDADIKDGDTVTILDAGRIEESPQYGTSTKFLINTRNGEKRATFNQSSINVLIDAYGSETEAWVGKKVNVLTKKGVFGGNKSIAAYFVTDGYSLDEYGDLVKEGDEKGGDLPTVEYPEGEANPEDIPFN